MFKELFSELQKIGKALMLPVAVLPVAGLLLGVGAANFSWMPPVISELMKNSGDVIFGNLPLIFAIGVALGFTENDGVSAVAATIGFLVMNATMGIVAKHTGVETAKIMGIDSIQTGVFGGIIAGLVAARLFNRYYRIQLPEYLGFFAGKRFVPIVTALTSIVVGLILAFVWPPIGNAIKAFSHWAAVNDPRSAATLYGFVERLLIPFGLHHIWNAPFFFETGEFTDASGQIVHGDIQRFFAGDPTAGIFAGAFFFKMFGLPAAAIAIWHQAKPQNRVAVGGIMLSAALTSFLTGITEPIEFSFLFVAPVLYVMHAFLVATAQFVANSLDMHMGFTFSQGGIDFLVFNVLGKNSHNWWLTLVLGPVYAAIYYVSFTLAIRWFDLKTPGREDELTASAAVASTGGNERLYALTQALGGSDNIKSLDACITRLRVQVNDTSCVSPNDLKKLGASGVMMVGTGVQAVFGPLSENLKTDLDAYIKSGHAPKVGNPTSLGAAQTVNATVTAPQSVLSIDATMVRQALGGSGNISSVELVAGNRVRVKTVQNVSPMALHNVGVDAVVEVAPLTYQLVLSEHAADLAKQLKP